MDRQVVFPGAVPLETDILNSERNTMVALAKLAAGLVGTAGFANGLTVAPNSPAALNVVVSPGEFYSLLNIDGTAYSSLAADTTHQILKQGILLDAVTLATAAPVTAGQSIVYLIQASVSESDTTPVVLPYYNASNPAQAYSGPAGAGTTNNTKRQCVISLQAKAGIAAATGSQTTPAPDFGFTGLYVVTVANGQTTVVAGNIAILATAPYLGKAALLNAANAFTVSPTAPTPAAADNTAKVATTAWARLGFSVSLGSNGYIAFPTWLGGLIFQWINSSVAVGGTTFTYPTPFLTSTFVVLASTNPNNSSNYAASYANTLAGTNAVAYNNAGATVVSNINILAIGY